VRAHLALRLDKKAYPLALLALLQPEPGVVAKAFGARSAEDVWREAQDRLTEDDPKALRTVLALPFDEALAALDLVAPTPTPLAAIAEQMALVHLADLYARLFVQMVQSMNGTSVASMIKGMPRISAPFEDELRAVLSSSARGSAAHGLALVLVGLRGVIGTSPSAAAQAALASSLAAEEMRGPPMASVRAMLELLYPGFAPTHFELDLRASAGVRGTARALDKLAMVMIGLVRMMVRYAPVAGDVAAKEERAERKGTSRGLARATGELRELISGVGAMGASEGEVDGERERFESAKERLVRVLTAVGRRATRRARGRDEDSGVDGEVEEL
jgi:hypothetical protein